METDRAAPWIDDAWLALAVLVPSTAAIASYYGARTVLLGVYLLLSLVVLLVILRPPNEQTLLALTFSISLSLILSFTLTSSNLIGGDIHGEYYEFIPVIRKGTYYPQTGSQYGMSVAVSILPTVIALITSLSGIQIFKFAFPIVLAMVPLVLCLIYRKLLEKQFVFLAIFLFMSCPTFYTEMIELGRQEIAEFLLAVLILLFLSPQISQKAQGRVLMIALTVGLVLSHYSLAYVYLLMLFSSYLLGKVSRNVLAFSGLTTLGISLVTAFSWYLFVAGGSAIFRLSSFMSTVTTGILQDFFNPSLRPSLVSQALGLSSVTPGPLHVLNRYTQYLVVGGLIFGFVVFFLKGPKKAAEKRMLSVMCVGAGMLGMSVLLPYFAGGLNLSRVFQISLIFLAPCLIYGTEKVRSMLGLVLYRSKLIRFVSLPTKRVFVATLLICYFLFTSGWVWAVTMDKPTSLVMDSQRMSGSRDLNLLVTYYSEYTLTSEIAGVSWARTYGANNSLCGDVISGYEVLTSYGEQSRLVMRVLPSECDNSYIYLSKLNSLNGVGIGFEGATWSIADIAPLLGSENRIYSGEATVSSPVLT
jgi:uncharacterized membrane protein